MGLNQAHRIERYYIYSARTKRYEILENISFLKYFHYKILKVIHIAASVIVYIK